MSGFDIKNISASRPSIVLNDGSILPIGDIIIEETFNGLVQVKYEKMGLVYVLEESFPVFLNYLTDCLHREEVYPLHVAYTIEGDISTDNIQLLLKA